MARKRPTTIAEYIRAAPREGQPHLRRLYAILKSVAPEAEETIKWGTSLRRRVDAWLRRALLDDAYELFADGHPPQVVALPPNPKKQLGELGRLVSRVPI